MKTRIILVFSYICFLFSAFVAGQLVGTRKPEPAIKEAFGQCRKCFHPGGFSINTPACGNGIPVTAPPGGNFQTLCNIGCLGTYFNCP